MNNKPLTKRQMELLNFMHLYFQQNDQLPPPEAIKEYFGWKSNNAVTCARDVLEKRGWIEKNATGKYRFVRAGRVTA